VTARPVRRPTAVVTGIGVALPGVESTVDLFARVAGAGAAAAPRAGEPADPVDPAARIGKKGLRYKDRATQLALVAGCDALVDSGLLESAARDAARTVPGSRIGVVVSSNLGNLDSVCDVAATIARDGTTRLLSPIVTPNLSSNVIASELAIRFGLRGPNLMVCNGETGGADALGWAVALLAAGRARHVLVVGVEPDNEVVRRLLGGRPGLDGAVALVLEAAATVAGRGRPGRAEIGGYVRSADVPAVLDRLAGAGEARAWYVPAGGAVPAGLLAGLPRHDPAAGFGVPSGALGVL
jgi:3-oxoacyl-[acyl-carrier-protein] synthase II